MANQITQSYALVTGASKGLGAAFVESLAAQGKNVVLVARSYDVLKAMAEQIKSKYGVQAVAISADLTNPDAPKKIKEELDSKNIEVELLINNAGLGLSGPFLTHELKKEEDEIQVNIQALVALTHLFGSAMAERRKGGIINIASNASFQPLPYMATYAATKAFVLHFSEALQYELVEKNVHVMASCPGPTATNFFEETSINLQEKDMDSAESVVQNTLKAFEKRKTVVYPGRTWGRLASLLPRLFPRTLVVRFAAMAATKMGLN
jgi:short-subunit dehydrogenase